MKKMKKLLFAMVLCGTLGIQVFAQEGVIKDVYGTVEIKPAGSAAFVPAKAGDKVAANTVVSTGFRSLTTIIVGSTSLTIRALTRMSLTEIQQAQGTELLRIELQTGRIRANIKPPAGGKTDMSVKSPIATASVRGTEFEFDTSTVTVHEGTVAFSGNGGKVMQVSAGGSSQIDAVTGRAADPVETGAAALLPSVPAGADDSGGAKSGGAVEIEYSIGFSF
jgi:hypothetical protein